VKKHITHYKSYTTPWDWVKGVVGAGSKAAEVGGKHLVEASTTLGKDAKDVAITLSEGAKEASANMGIEAVKTVADVAVPIVAVYSVWSMAKDVKNGCTDLYKWYYPNPEDVVRSEERREASLQKVAYLRAERIFMRSLVDNRCTPRGSTGIPIVCETHAHDFIAAGGKVEVEEMTKYFKESPLFNNCPC
jgi:hypothetical protein